MTAQELKVARADLELSQRELAELLGVPSNTLARWERGELAIAQPTILSLALSEIRRRVRRADAAEGA